MEKLSKVSLWKEFNVPLLYKDENKQLHHNGKPITIIARDPKLLHSCVFTTNCDDNGEQCKTYVVEIVGNNPCKCTYEMWNEWRMNENKVVFLIATIHVPI